jgi:hypothetical protein
LDQELELTEFVFGVKNPPPGKNVPKPPSGISKKDKAIIARKQLERIRKMESDYKSSGALPDKELELRLKALGEAIEQWAAKK